MHVTRPNQLWERDITCILIARGFACRAVVVEWYARTAQG